MCGVCGTECFQGNCVDGLFNICCFNRGGCDECVLSLLLQLVLVRKSKASDPARVMTAERLKTAREQTFLTPVTNAFYIQPGFANILAPLGIRPGDLILSISDKPFDRLTILSFALGVYDAGSLRVRRVTARREREWTVDFTLTNHAELKAKRQHYERLFSDSNN